MVLRLYHLTQIWGEPINHESIDINSPLGSVCTDSRLVSKGDFFVPLQGSKFDGHRFLQEAFEIGAQASVVSRFSNVPVPTGFPCWRVDDTLHAYQQLGLLHRRKLKAPVIAVTGSAGKTTTRELIKASLASLGQVISSTNNNNNDIGVPLTLLTADQSNCAIVVEMGMRGIGQIKRLSSFTQPDIAVITNVGSAHLGLLGSRSNIAKAKCEIVASLKPKGLVVIPAGNLLLEEELKQVWKGRVIRVGLIDDSKGQLEAYRESSFDRLPKADIIGNFFPNNNLITFEYHVFKLPLEGRHNAVNFLLALAVAKEMNVPFRDLSQLQVHLPSGHQGCTQIGPITVIDETYNSSPEAVKAALDLLVTKKGRHFAVLGTMLELGEESVDLHREVIEYADQLELDGLIIVTSGFDLFTKNLSTYSIREFAIVSSPEEAFKPLTSWLESGDILLLKASRGIQLDRLIPLLSFL